MRLLACKDVLHSRALRAVNLPTIHDRAACYRHGDQPVESIMIRMEARGWPPSADERTNPSANHAAVLDLLDRGQNLEALETMIGPENVRLFENHWRVEHDRDLLMTDLDVLAALVPFVEDERDFLAGTKKVFDLCTSALERAWAKVRDDDASPLNADADCYRREVPDDITKALAEVLEYLSNLVVPLWEAMPDSPEKHELGELLAVTVPMTLELADPDDD